MRDRDQLPEPEILLKLLGYLRHYLGATAEFRSEFQAKAIDSMRRKGSVCVISATGSGKSVIPFVASCIYPKYAQIVIVPLKSLLSDLISRARNMKATFCVWSPLETPVNPTGIMFVSVENAARSEFEQYLDNISDSVSKIFIEEAHLLVTQSYFRPALISVRKLLSKTSHDIVCITATLPPSYELMLSQSIGRNLYFLRDSSNRPNLRYFVQMLDQSGKPRSEMVRDFTNTCKAKLKTFVANSEIKTRSIVFVPQKSDIQIVKDYLEEISVACAFYHADLSDDERSIEYYRWKTGAARVMVATTAFGLGIDYPCVRFVLIIGFCYSVMDLSQLGGRAGRDGEMSDVVFVSSRHFIDNEIGNLRSGSIEMASGEAKNFGEFVLNEKGRCWRTMISHVLDVTSVSCITNPGCVLCNICKMAVDNTGTAFSGIPRFEIIQSIKDDRFKDLSAIQPVF
jgi:superfamily II DNA helicase RecQ